SVAPTEEWFTEELIPGTPLNRVPGAADRARAFAAARAALGRLVARTLRSVGVKGYVDALVREVAEAAAAPLFATQRATLGRTLATLARVIERLPGPSTVETAETHGDFQPGNVLVARDGVWLIDWEYTGRRQAGFDLLTHRLASRFPAGLAARVHEAAGGGDRLGEAMHGWPGVDWSTTEARRRALALFLLEELLVRVRENAS